MSNKVIEWSLDDLMTVTTPVYNIKEQKRIRADRDKIVQVCEDLNIGHMTKGYAFIGFQIDDVAMVMNVQDMKLTAKEDDGVKVYGVECIEGIINHMQDLLTNSTEERIVKMSDLKDTLKTFLDDRDIDYVHSDASFSIATGDKDLYIDTNLKVYSYHEGEQVDEVKGFDHWDEIPEIKRMTFSVI